jgi:hypothetical protein
MHMKNAFQASSPKLFRAARFRAALFCLRFAQAFDCGPEHKPTAFSQRWEKAVEGIWQMAAPPLPLAKAAPIIRRQKRARASA